MLFKKAIACLTFGALALLPGIGLAQDNHGNSGVGMSFSVYGLPLDFAEMDEEFGTIVSAFNPDGVLINAEAKLDMATVPGEISKLTGFVSIPGMFEASGSADLVINAESLTAYFEMDTTKQLEMTLISHFQGEYVDDGLLAMILTLGNRETGNSIPDLVAELEQEFKRQVGEDANMPIFAKLLQTVKDQIAQPGRVFVEYAPAQPTSPVVAMMEIMLAQEGGSFTLISEQGGSALMDMIPQGLLVEGGSAPVTNGGSSAGGLHQPSGHPDSVPVPQRPGSSGGSGSGAGSSSGGGKHTRNAF